MLSARRAFRYPAGENAPPRQLPMTKHMPAVPPANRSDKGPGDTPETSRDATHEKNAEPPNTSEQGDTANIKQNTTNKGYFRGRRMK
jgi:hypothetical protein